MSNLALTIPCPFCHVPKNAGCVTYSGNRRPLVHGAREDAALDARLKGRKP